jgi:hypothetical protein
MATQVMKALWKRRYLQKMKKTYHPYDETYARSQAWAKVARIAFVRDKIYAEPFSGSTPVKEIGSSMKYRLALLKSINPKPPAGFVGKWRNVEGESWLRPAIFFFGMNGSLSGDWFALRWSQPSIASEVSAFLSAVPQTQYVDDRTLNFVAHLKLPDEYFSNLSRFELE